MKNDARCVRTHIAPVLWSDERIAAPQRSDQRSMRRIVADVHFMGSCARPPLLLRDAWHARGPLCKKSFFSSTSTHERVASTHDLMLPLAPSCGRSHHERVSDLNARRAHPRGGASAPLHSSTFSYRPCTSPSPEHCSSGSSSPRALHRARALHRVKCLVPRCHAWTWMHRPPHPPRRCTPCFWIRPFASTQTTR